MPKGVRRPSRQPGTPMVGGASLPHNGGVRASNCGPSARATFEPMFPSSVHVANACLIEWSVRYPFRREAETRASAEAPIVLRGP